MGAHSDISELCRTSETRLESLSPYCTSSRTGLFISLSLLSFSSLNCFAFFFHPLPSPQPISLPIALHISPFIPPPLFSHLLPSLPWPLSSVPAGYSPDLDFHFPPLSCSYPLFLAVACSPTCFLPSSFHHYSFSFRGFPLIAFSQCVTLGISRRLKKEASCKKLCT